MAGNYEKGMYNQLMEVMAHLDSVEKDYKNDVTVLNDKIDALTQENTSKMTIIELKTLIWRYFISYWNNRRICSTNSGLPPMIKRQQYYAFLQVAA